MPTFRIALIITDQNNQTIYGDWNWLLVLRERLTDRLLYQANNRFKLPPSEFIQPGTKANFRVENQNGNNLTTDFSLVLLPGQKPVRVEIPFSVPRSDIYKMIPFPQLSQRALMGRNIDIHPLATLFKT